MARVDRTPLRIVFRTKRFIVPIEINKITRTHNYHIAFWIAETSESTGILRLRQKGQKAIFLLTIFFIIIHGRTLRVERTRSREMWREKIKSFVLSE